MIELFCFLKNGGDINRVTVLHVVEASNGADEAAADATNALKEKLVQFSVKQARCSRKQDTQKLLGCIVRRKHSCPYARRSCSTTAPPPRARCRRLDLASTRSSTKWCAAS